MNMLGLDPNTSKPSSRLIIVAAYWKHATITAAYVFFSSFTALFLKSLYSVVAITGSLGGSLIEAIIPAVL